MNILRSRFVGSVIYTVLTCSLWVLVFTPAHAIPPTPPVQLLLPNAGELAALQPENGSFTIPARVRAHQGVSKLTLIVRIIKTGTLERREGQVKNYGLNGLEKGKTRPVEIKIPAFKQDGIYRIEAALQIEQKEKTGVVVDKGVVYQVVEKGRARLTTPIELRKDQVSRQKEAFQKALSKEPKQPDIRLLMDSTVPVPAELKKQIKPYTGPKQEQSPPSGPPAPIKPYIIEKSKGDKTKDSHLWQEPRVILAQFTPLIEVRGQVVFENWYTNIPCNPFDPNDPYYPCTPGPPPVVSPLANATITLLMETGGFDIAIDTGVTDENGDWSFSVDPAFLGDDLYYTVTLENENFDVRDAAGNDYIWVSATRTATQVTNFGQETLTTNVEAAQVFDVVNRGWNHIVTEGGQDPGEIEIRYPDFCIVDGDETSCWDVAVEAAKLEAEVNDAPDTVLHEYGHGLMHYAFGTSIGGGAHSFSDLEQDLGVAFSEGWAHAFALAVCPDGYKSGNEGPYEDPQEWPTCALQNDGYQWIEGFDLTHQNRDGERHEGRVAAALNDFLDEPNDDNGANENRGKNGYQDANENDRISLATIYRDSMWGYMFNGFINFFIHLRTSLSTSAQTLADDIMTYNWMAWPITVPVPDTLCVASKIAMAMSPDYAATLEGLRSFRDQVLKPLTVGRRWAQSYYSHSPELAILLIGSFEARQAAQVIIKHFSQIGRSLNEPNGLERLSGSQEPALPPRVTESIKKIATVINAKGSAELKKDLAEARTFLKTFEDMSVNQAVRQVSAMEKVKTGKGMPMIQPMKFAPGSQNVDWELIKKNLPRDEQPIQKRPAKQH